MKNQRKLILILFILFYFPYSIQAQYSNLNWIFGDSCGIKFNTTGIDSFYTANIKARGTCATISDSLGNLLFYTASPDYTTYISGTTINFGVVLNKNHSIMQNGLYLKSTLWYNEMVIIPNPGLMNQFYIFTAGVNWNANPGLRYSIVDLNLNNGLGAVTQKNLMLDPLPIGDGLMAVRHGNGRDWWLLYKHSEFLTDTIFTYLISPSGISAGPAQKIGSNVESGAYRFSINPDGNLIAGSSTFGKLELFDFDRCSGLLSNHRYIRNAPSPSTNDKDSYWCSEFSSNGRFLYASTYDYNCYLFQFDLQASNIFSSRVMLDSIDVPFTPASALKRAPDNRIYRAIGWNNAGYPYPDSSYNAYNTHLSVINYPDSAGMACDYQAFSVYLPICRTYLGLPNNPDYTLGPIVGSPCDTLSVGITENLITDESSNLLVSPNPSHGRFKLSLISGVFFETPLYSVYNLQGILIQSGILSKENESILELKNVSSGLYLLQLEVGQKIFRKKIIITE